MLRAYILAGVLGVLATGPIGAAGVARAAEPAAPATQAADPVVLLRDLSAVAARAGGEIAQSKPMSELPPKVSIGLKTLENKAKDLAGKDLKDQTAKLLGFFKGTKAAERLAFADAPAAGAAAKPAFVLAGTVSSLPDTTSHLLVFQLTETSSSKVVWSAKFEVQSLE